ncbi:DUF1653 domain-containing protein [Alkalimarinus alittae]|uniref:DUF1653 domain-containing protein n=1 Tax=Alkalimarinus alittae TaxID=2961619 RepID=A0ABY6N6P7_9ALTE|nr:DUF1653 domain-containing protein [Alkalimarinus alittae]UZE97798.1 DUF1653 domain-containing protein [Alkalimarinus alittae]
MNDENISGLPEATSELPTGKYRHYKGNLYQVYGTATHSETLETLVVYRPLYGEGKLWVRPMSMFAELVNVNGEDVPRFAQVNE